MIIHLKRRRALAAATLVEVLIVFFIFTIVLVMVGDMSRLALHSQAATTERVEARRYATVALAQMRLELSTSRSFQGSAATSPPVGGEDWWSPAPDDPLIVRINVEGGTSIVAYWLEPDSGQVWKRVTASGQARPILRGVEAFEFQQNVQGNACLMAARIKMNRLRQPVNIWARAVRS